MSIYPRHPLQRRMSNRLRFMARAPDGKIYSWSNRNRMDKAARNKARVQLQQTPNYMMADEQSRQDMIAKVELAVDLRRKKRGIHVDCMFHGYARPILPVDAGEEEVAIKEDAVSKVEKEEIGFKMEDERLDIKPEENQLHVKEEEEIVDAEDEVEAIVIDGDDNLDPAKPIKQEIMPTAVSGSSQPTLKISGND